MMKEMKNGAYFHNDEAHNFNFVTNLTMSDKVTFVNSVADTVVGNNYNSLIRDMMFDHMIIQLFTDIGGFYFKDADDTIEAIEQFLEDTNIVDVVKANMDIGLLDELNKAVDKAIEYRTDIHPSPLNEALASLLSTLEKKVNEIDLGSAMDMVQKFVGMTGELTPESVVNAYVNSNIHQSNLAEVEEVKKQRAEFAKDMDKAIKAVNNK